MPKPKPHGKLKDIKIHEVSMVDLPANKLPFLFFKREGVGQTQFTKAKKKIKIEIESNGLVGGTKISVNGDDLGKLRSFDFSFYGDDPKNTIHASYSKTSESVDGFSRTETYYLTKGVFNMDKKTLKALQEFLGTEDIDFEKKIDEEEVQKALILITKEYKADLPEDLENAVGVIAKCAARSYNVKEVDKDVEKAGAKFSKDVLKKLKAVLASVEALKSILPDMKESTEKSDSSDEVAELTKKIDELTDSLAKGKNDELTETLDAMKKQIEALAKGGVVKTSIEEQENEDDDGKSKGAGKDGKVLWPTLMNQK